MPCFSRILGVLPNGVKERDSYLWKRRVLSLWPFYETIVEVDAVTFYCYFLSIKSIVMEFSCFKSTMKCVFLTRVFSPLLKNRNKGDLLLINTIVSKFDSDSWVHY